MLPQLKNKTMLVFVCSHSVDSSGLFSFQSTVSLVCLETIGFTQILWQYPREIRHLLSPSVISAIKRREGPPIAVKVPTPPKGQSPWKTVNRLQIQGSWRDLTSNRSWINNFVLPTPMAVPLKRNVLTVLAFFLTVSYGAYTVTFAKVCKITGLQRAWPSCYRVLIPDAFVRVVNAKTPDLELRKH